MFKVYNFHLNQLVKIGGDVKRFIGAIDQGTTSTRFMVFNKAGEIVASDQKEHEQIYPKPGWVEHNPIEIFQTTQQVMQNALAKSGLTPNDILAIGITNQRETTVVWDRTTGKPFYNAIVWQDTRTDQICNVLEKEGGIDRFRSKVGLPLATYFSGPKVRWILENVPEAWKAAQKGDALFGNIDSWLIWNLTGGVRGGQHVTDVSNASRTMLMNLQTVRWDNEMLDTFGIPAAMLPKIKPSSQIYGYMVDDCSGFRSQVIWVISKRRCSVKPASNPVKLKIPMAQDVSC